MKQKQKKYQIYRIPLVRRKKTFRSSKQNLYQNRIKIPFFKYLKYLNI